MSTSKFDKPLTVIKNIGFNLLLASENKDSTCTLLSTKKSYDIKPEELVDKFEYKHQITNITLATQSKLWFAVLYDDQVEIFSIVKETGKFTPMFKFKADFSKDSPRVNTAKFVYGNEYIVTGGNDKTVRVWKLKIDKNKDLITDVEKVNQITTHTTSITHVDVTFDKQLIASIGHPDEKQVLIHGMQQQEPSNELTFSEKINDENFNFYSALFSHHRKFLYTLASLGSRSSYVTQWDALSPNFESLQTVKVHSGPCKNLALSYEGFYLAIGS